MAFGGQDSQFGKASLKQPKSVGYINFSESALGRNWRKSGASDPHWLLSCGIFPLFCRKCRSLGCAGLSHNNFRRPTRHICFRLTSFSPVRSSFDLWLGGAKQLSVFPSPGASRPRCFSCLPVRIHHPSYSGISRGAGARCPFPSRINRPRPGTRSPALF